MSPTTRGRQPLCLARTPSTNSERSSTLSLSLTDADVSLEDSFDFNDDGDIFLRGGNLAIGSGGLAMRDNPKTFRVAYEDLEIGPVIGKGSTGAVLEAVHKPTGTRLALKVINIYDKGRRNQLIREICTLYDASCPSLVTFYGAFHREGCITLALEMMDGGALSNLVAQLGPIPEAALANMVFQILWALAYLKHDKRVHRDIKPSNLLINSRGEVKVTDFGVSAELQSSVQMCGTFVGTFKYMSPERIRNQPYNYASDIWSLGLTLIECATGRYPYPDSKNCIDMIQAITEGEPPTLPATGPNGRPFSPEFRSFLDNLLKKDPKRRLPPEILLGAPWLRQSGAVSLAVAVRNTKHWIHHDAVPSGASAARAAAAAGSTSSTSGGAPPPVQAAVPHQPLKQQQQQHSSFRLAPVVAAAAAHQPPPLPPAGNGGSNPVSPVAGAGASGVSSLPSPPHVIPPSTPPPAAAGSLVGMGRSSSYHYGSHYPSSYHQHGAAAAAAAASSSSSAFHSHPPSSGLGTGGGHRYHTMFHLPTQPPAQPHHHHHHPHYAPAPAPVHTSPSSSSSSASLLSAAVAGGGLGLGMHHQRHGGHGHGHHHSLSLGSYDESRAAGAAVRGGSAMMGRQQPQPLVLSPHSQKQQPQSQAPQAQQQQQYGGSGDMRALAVARPMRASSM